MTTSWRTATLVSALLCIVGVERVSADPPLSVSTAAGTLQVESVDPAVQIRLGDGGESVTFLDTSTSQEVTIETGANQKLTLRNGTFGLATDHLLIERDGRVLARLTLIPKPATAAPGFRDAFDNAYQPAWIIVGPDPSHVSLTKKPGALTITTQPGGIWKRFNNAKNLFVIDNPILDGADFVMTTRLDGFDPQSDYNQAGLLCYDDMDNFLIFSLQWDSNQGGRILCQWAESHGQGVEPQESRAVDALDRVWLRVTKKGSDYTASFSQDGEKYETIGTTTWGEGSPAQVGLIAKNGAPRNAPELDASFDFFEIRGSSLPAVGTNNPEKAAAVDAKLVDGALYVMNADGSGLARVAAQQVGGIGTPAWSPDGKSIAYDVYGPGGFNDQHVVIVELKSDELTDLGVGGFPSWSGDKIAYHDSSWTTRIVDRKSGEESTLPGGITNPRLSPDGDRVAGLREVRQLVVLDLDTQWERAVFDNDSPKTQWGCSWSPDGKQLAASCLSGLNDNTDDLVVVDSDSDGTNQGRRVLYHGSIGSHVSWSSDGKRIMAGVYPEGDGPRHLWSFPADGKGAGTEIPGQDPGWEYCDGAWSPDGKALAFSVRKHNKPADQ